MDVTVHYKREICTVIVAAVLLSAGVAYTVDTNEKAKIEYLITSIGELRGATFIRNGTEYNTQAAMNHLRRKLRAAGEKVTTAEQFIEYCASRSSMSGEPYTIRLADGTVTQSAVYFRDLLRKYRPVNSR